MLGSTITLRDAGLDDESEWRRLWNLYNRFYDATIPETVTAYTWRRILDPASTVLAKVAAHGDGTLAGFSIAVLHEGTWSTAQVCYLEDLFVDPSARGAGIGRALIQDLVDRGTIAGWSRLYWHTEAGNAAARRLYDTFAQADTFVRYRLPLS